MFHSMFLLDPRLIYKIPKRCGISLGSFGIVNINKKNNSLLLYLTIFQYE